MSKSYVTHDSNARNSKKMLRMREKLGPVNGPAVYGIYWMLIERLRDDENYVSDKDYEMLAFDLRCDKELLRMTVEDFGLFDISEDGKTFGSHGLEERMEFMETKRAAGKKGAEKRWANRQKNGHEMAQNGIIDVLPQETPGKTPGIILNKTNNNKITSSLSLSFPSSGKDTKGKDEEEKQKIIYFFTFKRNWAAPSKEYDRLIAFNKGISNWRKLPVEKKEDYVTRWRPENPDDGKRFDKEFLAIWQQIYDEIIEPSAQAEIKALALSDEIKYEKRKDGIFYLSCSLELKEFLEEEHNLVKYKKLIWPFIQSLECRKITYLCKY